MGAGTTATIDLGALKHNLQQVRLMAPNSQVMAVIKANAYGHGMIPIANALSDADAFAVARVSEAIHLRQSNIHHPIIVLEGFYGIDELMACLTLDIQVVFHHSTQIDRALNHAPANKLMGWLKIDTGMHRLGFQPDTADKAYQKLSEFLDVPLRLLTHLANSDDTHDNKTNQQLALFNQFQTDGDLERSCANSGGILGWPDCHYDWVRPGIMLYGSSPFNGLSGKHHNLQPVMTLSSPIIAINQIKKGESIGYSGTWVCTEDTTVGVIAMGYGDGYPRHAPSGTPVLINQQQVPLIGRVSMDMITVNLTGFEHISLGDQAILWGKGLPVEIIAQYAKTISYELFCQITHRVTFQYINQ